MMMFERIRFIDELHPRTRKHVLRALEIITRPLTREELDDALKGHMFHSRRREAVEALANLDIVAIVYRSDDTSRD